MNEPMNELLRSLEEEVLGWPGISKKRDEDGPGGEGVTGYRITEHRYGKPNGGPQIGHVHDGGHADFSFPKEVRDELIEAGRAFPHPAFPNSRTTVSFDIESEDDLPHAISLFRMNYERLKEVLDRKAASR